MKIALKPELLWVNKMPMIIPDGADRDSVSRSLPGLEIQVQLEDPLPIGEYEVQVIVTGPEGPSQFASARLRVSEAC